MRRVAVVIALFALAQAGCLRVQPRIPLGDILPGGGGSDWEYRHEVHCADPGDSPQEIAREQSDLLNRLGGERWELVDVQLRPASSAARADCWILTLKRRAD